MGESFLSRWFCLDEKHELYASSETSSCRSTSAQACRMCMYRYTYTRKKASVLRSDSVFHSNPACQIAMEQWVSHSTPNSTAPSTTWNTMSNHHRRRHQDAVGISRYTDE
ncbi:hypothetical protein H257_07080 [Aphanomyces astaci]|uniref:Uncharacterized protein n=1 Tax=Aphanomyces astaci TaxID=112090 RepID=W4GJI0_APHAT|nr:hypothetical protein H257_07080 [Aphanomyces astaci]ETV79865.1 hypothetical protein H257_07080 [Aphanomyces astaci]|eukprot:XP_009830801.1 hypothetical protein H257_07080 [Aphanomyces astaci]